MNITGYDIIIPYVPASSGDITIIPNVMTLPSTAPVINIRRSINIPLIPGTYQLYPENRSNEGLVFLFTILSVQRCRVDSLVREFLEFGNDSWTVFLECDAEPV